VTRTEIGGTWVTLVLTHPLPPADAASVLARNQQLQGLASLRPKVDPALIVVGDLNTTPYSQVFKQFVRATGLRDSARGYGLRPTWPTDMGPLGITIDYVLASPEFVALNRQVGPYAGSDHLPVVVELGLISSGE
jgi:endonuclease/exonuclease/phosphatase (EEP) superfamily protein YafD